VRLFKSFDRLQRHLWLIAFVQPADFFHIADDRVATKLNLLAASTGTRGICIQRHASIRFGWN
jgi:hypothetical protein